jgi:hypothetical protein
MTAMFEFYNLLPLAVSTAPLSVMVPPNKNVMMRNLVHFYVFLQRKPPLEDSKFY